jgi:hypothetical protein
MDKKLCRTQRWSGSREKRNISWSCLEWHPYSSALPVAIPTVVPLVIASQIVLP